MDLRATIEALAVSFANEVLGVIRQMPLSQLGSGSPRPPAEPPKADRPKRGAASKPAPRASRKARSTPPAKASNIHGTIEDLKARRIARGLSQRQLAERIGIKQPHVANVERHHSTPGADLLARWKKALS